MNLDEAKPMAISCAGSNVPESLAAGDTKPLGSSPLGGTPQKLGASMVGNTGRVQALDYLRGLLALGVMLYHYKSGVGITFGYPIEQVFQRIGLYAVCTFYVLSGMSLGIVYARRQVNVSFLLEFAVKRFFRIAPLFWAATTLTIALRWFICPILALEWGGLPRHAGLLAIANYSLSFGWLRPDAYIPMGGWSIGNEMVFYSLFPGLLVLMKMSRRSLAATFLLTFVISMAFTFGLIDRNSQLGDSNVWCYYINPINHLFLFAGGVALAILCADQSPHPKLLLSVLLVSLASFVFWPTQGRGGAILITGWERVLFSGLSFAFCYVALKWPRGFGQFAGALVWIGNISYAVYLLHPVIGDLSSILNTKVLHADPRFVSCCLALPATVIASMVSWKFYEKPMMQFGRWSLSKLPSVSGKMPCGARVLTQ